MTAPRRPDVVGVLLAAGAGHRLGRGPKALLALDGEPQVARTVSALRRGGCRDVIVVIGAGAAEVRRVLGPLDCRTVENGSWASGIGSSFRAGIDAAHRWAAGRRDTADLANAAALVALVDQPDVGEAVVAHLIGSARQHRVTAAGYPDPPGRLRRGHPVLFPLDLARQAAATAVGDAAGRDWLRAHPDLVDVVDVGHLATGRDVDTPADLARWARRTAPGGTVVGA